MEIRESCESLALRINPNIEISMNQPTASIVVGTGTEKPCQHTIFVGSSGWDARCGSGTPIASGDSQNPFGAGMAACIGAANAFRMVFMDDPQVETEAIFSTFDMSASATDSEAVVEPIKLSGRKIALIGAAIGQAAIWAFSRTDFEGILHVVDHENVEMSNLQRYVLTEIGNVGRSKVDIAMDAMPGPMMASPHQMSFSTFVQQNGYDWDRLLVAVDRAERSPSSASQSSSFHC